MNVNSVSSNPILNNPTFNKTQTRELPADQALDAQTRTDQPAATARSILPEDTLSLSAGALASRPGQVQGASSELSADAAQTMTRTLTQLMNNNPSQAMQAIGIPDNRMVQSLLSVV